MDTILKPKIIVFAGPNGSGKSSNTPVSVLNGNYINADDIKKRLNLSDIEAAQEAERQRENSLSSNLDFSFETVLSTDRNLNLLIKAKQQGYFIRGYYILTRSSEINVTRVKLRSATGGHDVPVEKIISRYNRALKILPQFIEVCDICTVYDNSLEEHESQKIFKKKYHEICYYRNELWSLDDIQKLTEKE